MLLSLSVGMVLLSNPAVGQQRALAPKDAPVADNLVVIVADIQRHTGEDLYRYPAPTDVLGQNVFRAGLIRMANWEKLHPGQARDVLAINRALCWERLGAFGEAEREYREAEKASPDATIKRAAAEGAATATKVQEIIAVPTDQSIPRVYEAQLRDQARALDQLARSLNSGQPARAALVRSLRERVDIRLAEFLAAVRFISPYTTQDAVTALKANVETHRNSRLQQWHKLRLAEFYIELAKEYCIRYDPEGADFVLKDFMAYCDPARKLLLEVERADGFPEKPEARHRLASLEAFITSTGDRAR
jgi:tetratricopeptide (TPR) repeat protein